MRTPWGYDVAETLEPLLSAEEFDERTQGAFSGNPRAESALNAASQVVRNYCGWHICPSVDCTAEPFGEGRIRRLPAAYVSAVESVTENGETVDPSAYEWRKDGLIRRSGRWADGWNAVEVTYTAGYDIDAVPDLAEAVTAIAAGVLSVSAGVQSESADGVSISYSTSASSIAAGLTGTQKSALEAYKVVTAHAT